MTQLALTLTAPTLYLILGLFIFGESAFLLGLVLPSETTLLLAGVRVEQGKAGLLATAAVALGAAVAGDGVGYLLGRFGVRSLRTGRFGRLIKPARWQRAEDLVGRYGSRAVMLARWTAVMRTLVPPMVGATGMPYRRFAVVNAASAAVWVAGVLGIGYLAGESWNELSGYFGAATVSVPLAVLLVVGAVWWLRRRRHSS
jgi:membrane protein DedA with SNARE-associated domain